MANTATAIEGYAVRVSMPNVPAAVGTPSNVTVGVELFLDGISLSHSVIRGPTTDFSVSMANLGFATLFLADYFGTETILEDDDYTIDVTVYEGLGVVEMASDLAFTVSKSVDTSYLFAPHFAVKASADRTKLVIYDAENNWPGGINAPFQITVTSSYDSDLGVDISKTLTNTELGIGDDTLQEGFEIEIPIEDIDATLTVVPDSIYTVKLEVLQSSAVVASREIDEVVYQETKDYVYSKALDLNTTFPKWNNSRDVVIDKSQIDLIELAMDDSNESVVIEILKYFKALIG